MRSEQANKILAGYATNPEAWLENKRPNIQALPNALRAIAFALLGRDAKGKSLNSYEMERWQEIPQTIQQLGQCSPQERGQIWQALFPAIAPDVEQGWQLHDRLPYRPYGLPFRIAETHLKKDAARIRWIQNVLMLVQQYEQPIAWYAQWSAYLYPQEALGILLAAAIERQDEQSEEVYEILRVSAAGEHPIGKMGTHVVRAFLICERETAWELIENLLIAAQRQEGLRQVILESVAEAHPLAFRRLVQLILREDLLRFSSVVAAVNCWFLFNWKVEHKKTIQRLLENLTAIWSEEESISEILQGNDPQKIYLALWSKAFDNVLDAVPLAANVLSRAEVEVRFVGVLLLSQMSIPEVEPNLISALGDADLRVAAQAYLGLNKTTIPRITFGEVNQSPSPSLIQALKAFADRVPATPPKIAPIVWEWMMPMMQRNHVVYTLWQLCEPLEMLPYWQDLDTWSQSQLVQEIAKNNAWQPELDEKLWELIGTRNAQVRSEALALLSQYFLDEVSLAKVENLFTRKSSEVRRDALQFFLKQTDEMVLASTERLLNSSKGLQRSAGLELASEMIAAQRSVAAYQTLIETYQQQRRKLTQREVDWLEKLSTLETAEIALETAASSVQETWSLDNGLGLFRPEDRSPVISPQFPQQEIQFFSEAAKSIVLSLDERIHSHCHTPVNLQEDWEELLGNLHWFLEPSPQLSQEENLQRFPLAEIWLSWWHERSEDLRDEDGNELLRSIAISSTEDLRWGFIFGMTKPPLWARKLRNQFQPQIKGLRYEHLIVPILSWLLWLEPDQIDLDFLLDATEYTLASIHQHFLEEDINPEEKANTDLAEDSENQLGESFGNLVSADAMSIMQALGVDNVNSKDTFDWRSFSGLTVWLDVCRSKIPVDCWSPEQYQRLWQLLRWYDEPIGTVPKFLPSDRYSCRLLPHYSREGFLCRSRPSLEEILIAYTKGTATKADIYDRVVGREQVPSFRQLSILTQRSRETEESEDEAEAEWHLVKQYPFLKEIVDHCRDRVLEIECQRGDLPTIATEAALSLQSVPGMENVLRILQAFGEETLVRGWRYDQTSKASVLSHLLRVSFPTFEDTPEGFAERVQSANISDQRFIEFALYSPQWLRYVEAAIQIPSFAEAVWWFHAHTKDSHWEVETSIREGWKSQIAEYTPLSAQDLLDGAVDVAWFWRVYRAIGAKNWQSLDKAAKFASGGKGHTRARLFADAMLGKLDRSEVIKRIQDKRHQDSMRALGLIPLTDSHQETDLLERYELLQEVESSSKQFGSQRRASEKLAVKISLENLSCTAGYADPQRLEWAMEACAIADFAEGGLSYTEGEVTISLTINETGAPILAVVKKGKPQKTIPAALKKNPEVAALQKRKQQLTKQLSRMRQSLERAMCRSDRFSSVELQQLLHHPTLAPLLEMLLFVVEMPTGETILGYPTPQGLRRYDDSIIPIPDPANLYIAHPCDLLASQEWTQWQQECFDHQRKQPFKQIFRELYVPIATEQTEGKGSQRYAGHQVNPRQAKALLGQRGWVTGNYYDEDIDAHRHFYEEELTAIVEMDYGWTTVTSVEGLTLQTVYFCQRRDGCAIALDEVPPRIFSEVMRDLDLVVSVAHQGGVDPEASASTIEMRMALLHETNRLLKLNNVNLQGNYALIQGDLGEYSVHLGSGVVHRQPGGSLCIVSVQGQHRGRLFLPFADDDPKTAEVIAKVLLLAKDREIKDPTILEQLL